MKLWVLYDVDKNGEILGISAVTKEYGIAEMWRRESRSYRAGQFETDKAAEYVSDVFAINFECSTEFLQ